MVIMGYEAFLARLREERARIWNESMEVLDRAESESRSTLTEEEREKIGRINKRIDEIDEQERDWLDRAKREHEADLAREQWADFTNPPAKSKNRTDEPTPDDRQRDELRAFLLGETKGFDISLVAAGREKELLRAGLRGGDFREEMRVLTTFTAAQAGTLVPTTFERQLYDYLEVYTGMRRAGARVITTTSGEPMDFPQVTAHGTAAAVGEGTAAAEANASFGKTTLNSFKFGALAYLSSEMIADSGVDIVGFVAKDTARSIGRVTDTAYVTGAGTSGPKGIVTASATAIAIAAAATANAAIGIGTGCPSYGNLLTMIYSVNEEYRAQGARWLTADTNMAKLRSLIDTTGRPLWEPSLQVGQPDRLLGYPVSTDPNMATMGSAAKSLMFGAMDAFLIRDSGTLRYESSSEYKFGEDLITYRGLLRTDSDLLDTNAVKLFVGGTA